MDCNKTINFFREIRRWCDKSTCDKCPLSIEGCHVACGLTKMPSDKFKELLNRIQRWSDEHPCRTYKIDFLEKFPNAIIDEKGAPIVCR